MKRNIHPKAIMSKIFTVKKEIVELPACLPEEFHLSMDPSNHPAWTKSDRNTSTIGKAAEFAKKHKGIEDL